MKKGISFTVPVFDTKLIMVRNVEPPVIGIDYFNWLIPFENNVWWVLLSTIIISSFIFQFIEYVGNGRDERSFRKWTADNIYLSFLNFTQNFSYEPKTVGGRVFAISFSFWAMLVGAAYTANLASLLVEGSKSGFVLVNFEDAIARDMSICVEDGSAAYDELLQKYPESKPLLILKDIQEDMYRALNNKECDLLVGTQNKFDELKLQDEYNPYCYLKWEGREVMSINEAFATAIDPGKCTSIVNEVFNYYLTSMKDDVTLAWKEHVFRKATRESCDKNNPNAITTEDNGRRQMMARRNLMESDDYDSGESVSESDESLSLNQMVGTFLVHIVGSLIAIALSLFSFYGRKKNDIRDDTMNNVIIGDEEVNESVHTTPVHNRLLLHDRLNQIESSQKASHDMIMSMLKAMQKEIKSDDDDDEIVDGDGDGDGAYGIGFDINK